MKTVRFAVTLLAASIAFTLSTTFVARADGEAPDAQTWLVRVRALDLIPANQSTAIAALGVPSNAITINAKIIPDVDISYFFRDPHVAAELVLTYPQQQSVYLRGAFIGTFEHLPPSLLLQYHFAPGATLQPYVGVGINETLITGSSLHVPGVGALTLDSSSTGVAYQAGADVKTGRNRYVNIDGKYIGISSNVYAGSVKVSTVSIDPWLLGIGYGLRF